MKSNKLISIIAIVITFIIFNVLAFVIPSDFTSSFWISYVFSILAFALVLLIVSFSNKLESINKGIFPYSLLYYTGVYVIIDLIIFLLTKFISEFPAWLSIVLNVLLLGIYGYLFISVYLVSKNSNTLKKEIGKKVFYLKDLQTDIEIIATKEEDKEVKQKLDKLAENLKYSDPMSNENLQELELKIKDKVDELKKSSNKLKVIEEIQSLLEERNKKSKILKENN